MSFQALPPVRIPMRAVSQVSSMALGWSSILGRKFLCHEKLLCKMILKLLPSDAFVQLSVWAQLMWVTLRGLEGGGSRQCVTTQPINSALQQWTICRKFLDAHKLSLASNWSCACRRQRRRRHFKSKFMAGQGRQVGGWLVGSRRKWASSQAVCHKSERQQGVTCDKIELKTCFKSKINKPKTQAANQAVIVHSVNCFVSLSGNLSVSLSESLVGSLSIAMSLLPG